MDPAKTLDKEDGTTAKVDDKLEFKGTEFNKTNKKIVLSHAKIADDQKKETEVKEKAADADNTKNAVKKIKSNIEKTTLGDIDALAALKSEMEKSQNN